MGFILNKLCKNLSIWIDFWFYDIVFLPFLIPYKNRLISKKQDVCVCDTLRILTSETKYVLITYSFKVENNTLINQIIHYLQINWAYACVCFLFHIRHYYYDFALVYWTSPRSFMNFFSFIKKKLFWKKRKKK